MTGTGVAIIYPPCPDGTTTVESVESAAAQKWRADSDPTTGAQIITRRGDELAIFWQADDAWFMVTNPLDARALAHWDRHACLPSEAFPWAGEWLTRVLTAHNRG